jgi:hypothetical protein
MALVVANRLDGGGLDYLTIQTPNSLPFVLDCMYL